MIFRRRQPPVTREEALRARPRRLVDAELEPTDNGAKL